MSVVPFPVVEIEGRALPRVGYVVKRYPRYSETFIVTELLSHEAAGMEAEVFALLPCNDSHFQDAVSRVRAPVRYLAGESPKGSDLWAAMRSAADEMPGAWEVMRQAAVDGEAPRDVYHALLLARAVRQSGIGHLHAHFATSATNVARMAAQIAGVPYTFTAHAKDIFHESVSEPDLRRKITDAAAVITVSDYNQRDLLARFGVAAANVHRVYNGLNLGRFRFEPPAQRPPVIVAVGRLVEKKGFDDLVTACARLRALRPQFTCQIIGEGEMWDALRAQIGELGLGDVVELLGARPQPEVVRAIRGAAAFAAPCVVGSDANRDGLPTVLLEAMALGTPCVSTDVTGIPEVLSDGRTGLMVPQHDPPRLAAALARLLDDADLRVRLATAARRLVEAEFDTRRNAATLRDVFAACHTSAVAPPAADGARRRSDPAMHEART